MKTGQNTVFDIIKFSPLVLLKYELIINVKELLSKQHTGCNGYFKNTKEKLRNKLLKMKKQRNCPVKKTKKNKN